MGSTVLLTDSSGNIVWQNDFTPFGEETGESGFLERDGFYTGKKIDPDTGLYYHNARWYDPTLGIFITEDPIKSGNNWFSYANQNPLRYTDPTGLQAQPLAEPDTFASIRDTFHLVKESVQSNPAVQTVIASVSSFLLRASVYLAPLAITGDSMSVPLPPGYKQEGGMAWSSESGAVTPSEAWDVFNSMNSSGDETPSTILNDADGTDPTRTKMVNGKTVSQDDDLIDPEAVDRRSRTNRERMEKGLSPIGPDGKSVVLHHTDQTNDGPVEEKTTADHQENYKELHANTGQDKSQIDRKEFSSWRRNYWKSRSDDFVE